ncbi:MAG: HAMP domain-containing protein [Chromatiales bacterium]|nr:HAMP domain-containing protein [Chromatiales bacterium]
MRDKYVSIDEAVKELIRRFNSHSIPIAFKLAIVITLLISSGMILLGIAIVSDQSKLMQHEMEQMGETITSQLADSAGELLLANDTLRLELIINNIIQYKNIKGVAIYSDQLTKVVASGLIPKFPSIAQRVNKSPYKWTYSAKQQERTALLSFVRPLVFRNLTVGYAELTFDHSLMERARNSAIYSTTITTIFMILVGIVVSIIIGVRLTLPIHRIINVSQAITDGKYSHRFDDRRNDEIGSLMSALDTMSAGLLRKEQVENTFSRYVSPKVANEILQDLEQVELGGKHVHATVLFADIVGFTSMSEQMNPEEVNTLLNEYFTYVDSATHAYHGHIDKYMGDCAMVVFGIPEEDKDQTFHAISCALLIQKLTQQLNDERHTKGLPAVEFRIGINSGMMLAGNMGSKTRMEYTVVGDAVNLASRLSSAASGREIIISDEMQKLFAETDDFVMKKHDTIKVRGKKEPVSTYLVQSLQKEHQHQQDKIFKQILQDQDVNESS